LILIKKLLDTVLNICNQVIASPSGGQVHVSNLEFTMKFTKVSTMAIAAVAFAGVAQAAPSATEEVVIGGLVVPECSFSDIDPLILDLDIVQTATADGLELIPETTSTSTPYVGCNFIVGLTMTSLNGGLDNVFGPTVFNPAIFTNEIDYQMNVTFEDVAGTEITGFNSKFFGPGDERVRGPYGPFWSDLTVTVTTEADLRPVAGIYFDVNTLRFGPVL